MPNDGNDLAHITRAIHVGGIGDLRVTMADGSNTVTSAGMAAGWHPVRVRLVLAIGTTSIVECFWLLDLDWRSEALA